MAMKQAISVFVVILMMVCMGDLQLCAFFDVVKTLAVDMQLGATFIDECIRPMVFLQRGGFPLNSSPAAILLSKRCSENHANILLQITLGNEKARTVGIWVPKAKVIQGQTESLVMGKTFKSGFMTI